MRLLLLILALRTIKSGIIKGNKYETFETNNKKYTKIRNSPERELAGGEGDKEKNIDPSVFLEAVQQMVYSILEKHYPGKVRSGDKEIVVHKGSEEKTFFKLTFKSIEGGILDIPMVETSIDLGMLDYKFAIQRTPLRGAPVRKIKLSINNFIFLSKQYIQDISDVAGEMSSTLALILEANGGKAPEERRLVELKDYKPSKIKHMPLLSAFREKPLDLKRRTYTVDTPECNKVFARALKITKDNNQMKRKKSRKLLKAPDQLTESDGQFIRNKRDFMSDDRFVNDLFMNFVMVEAMTGGDESQPHKANFVLSPVSTELGDVRGEIFMSNTAVIMTLSHPSFIITANIYFPSKRNVLKNLVVIIEDARKLAKMLHNLGDLQAWRDHRHLGYEKQVIITELLQPTLLYYLFRQEFDNRTNGMTVTGPDHKGKILSYQHTENMDSDEWKMEIKDERNTPRKKILESEIKFFEYGDGFQVGYFISKLYIYGMQLELGVRQFPDYSMFNQHVLAIRYIDMQAEFVTRYLELNVPGDFITPFPIQELIYNKEPPAMSKNTDFRYNGVRSVDVLLDSTPIVNYDENIMYESSLCPLRGIEFDDTIKMSMDGESFIYKMNFGSRNKIRWDVDYCSVASVVADDKGEERRLQDKSDEGFLV